MSDIIRELELSVRTTNVLNAMGTVQTLDDFMALTEAEVRAQRGAGARTWREIKDVQQNLRDPVGHPSTWPAEVEALHRRVAELEAALREISDVAKVSEGPAAQFYGMLAGKALKTEKDRNNAD